MGEIDGNTANKKAGSSMSESRSETGSTGVLRVVSGSEDGSEGVTATLIDERGTMLATLTIDCGSGFHYESLTPGEYRFDEELPVVEHRGGDSDDGRAFWMILDWMDRIVNPTAIRGRRTWADLAGSEARAGSDSAGERVLVMRYDEHGNSIDSGDTEE